MRVGSQLFLQNEWKKVETARRQIYRDASHVRPGSSERGRAKDRSPERTFLSSWWLLDEFPSRSCDPLRGTSWFPRKDKNLQKCPQFLKNFPTRTIGSRVPGTGKSFRKSSQANFPLLPATFRVAWRKKMSPRWWESIHLGADVPYSRGRHASRA